MNTNENLLEDTLTLLAKLSAHESKINMRLENLMVKLDKRIKELENQKEPLFAAKDLEVGEMMVIIDPEFCHNGHIIMRTYDRILSLTKPDYTWSNPEKVSFRGRKLKKGETFTLTQK